MTKEKDDFQRCSYTVLENTTSVQTQLVQCPNEADYAFTSEDDGGVVMACDEHREKVYEMLDADDGIVVSTELEEDEHVH